MALYADRVKQSLGITGTGTVTLTLATTGTGYQSFLSAFGTGTQTVAYCIADQSGPNWEVGTGDYNGSANTLARTTVLASSNGGSLTNFSGGTQDVFCTAPAKFLDTFTSTNQGTVPASGGGTTNFLRADGTFAAPPAVTPASPSTSVQFNNAGAFGGSANFTYSTSTNTFTVGPAGATTTIETLAPTGSTVAGTLRFRGKNASATNGAGGGFQFASGNALGTGTGGGIGFTAGTSPSGLGGSIGFSASAGATGGSLEFNSGTGSTGPAGNVVISAAPGSGATSNGGTFLGTAGNAANNGNGGNITLLSGSSGGSGLGGNFDFRCGFGAGGSGSMSFSTDNFTIIQLTENGTPEAQLGFYGTTPVAKPAPTASGTGNVLSSVVTALNSLGLVSSAALTNASTLTAAGSNTQIQFNNAGAFGATAGFSYDTSTSTFNIAPASTNVIIEPVAPTGAQTSSSITLRTKNASATNGVGGNIFVSTGSGLGTGASGRISFVTAASSNVAGPISFVAGNGTNEGGSMTFAAGAGGSPNGNGGGLTLSTGLGRGTGGGGAIEISTGNGIGATSFGGMFSFIAGSCTLGTGGDFQLLAGGGATSGSIYIGTNNNSSCLTLTEDVSSNVQMGFFNAAPVTQPTTATASATRVAVAGTVANIGDTYDGYTLAKVVKALRNLGILA